MELHLQVASILELFQRHHDVVCISSDERFCIGNHHQREQLSLVLAQQLKELILLQVASILEQQRFLRHHDVVCISTCGQSCIDIHHQREQLSLVLVRQLKELTLLQVASILEQRRFQKHHDVVCISSDERFCIGIHHQREQLSLVLVRQLKELILQQVASILERRFQKHHDVVCISTCGQSCIGIHHQREQLSLVQAQQLKELTLLQVASIQEQQRFRKHHDVVCISSDERFCIGIHHQREQLSLVLVRQLKELILQQVASILKQRRFQKHHDVVCISTCGQFCIGNHHQREQLSLVLAQQLKELILQQVASILERFPRHHDVVCISTCGQSCIDIHHQQGQLSLVLVRQLKELTLLQVASILEQRRFQKHHDVVCISTCGQSCIGIHHQREQLSLVPAHQLKEQILQQVASIQEQQRFRKHHDVVCISSDERFCIGIHHQQEQLSLVLVRHPKEQLYQRVVSIQGKLVPQVVSILEPIQIHHDGVYTLSDELFCIGIHHQQG
ncbi:hypothetical protein ACFFRR_010989 [Megaselia abdita]